MLDSGMVLLAGAINLSALPVPAIIAADIAGVALVILLMALGGDFNLAEETGLAQQESAPTLEERTALLALECNLTERESEVLAALVLTEKKNQQIADDLSISRRQLQIHISRVYEKTGVTTRAGLAMRVNS